MFFMPTAASEASGSLEDRIRRLERVMVLSLDALQTVVERLEDRLGPDVVGPELKRLISTEDDSSPEQLLAAIERAVEAGDKAGAAREFRQVFACTWDQAHEAVRKWRSHSHEQKLRWLRLSLYIRHVDASDSQ